MMDTVDRQQLFGFCDFSGVVFGQMSEDVILILGF